MIGTVTAGNVAAGQVFGLPDGSALQVTVFRLETPSGVQLNEVGVQPDEVVERTPEDVRVGRDPQLDKALAYLREQSEIGESARPTIALTSGRALAWR